MLRSLALGSLAPALLLAGLAAPAAAEVVPAPIFGDHMVLQAGVKAPVFGTTEPGGTVAVSALLVQNGAGEALETITETIVFAAADDAGRWQAEVGPFESGVTLTLVVADVPERDENYTADGVLKDPAAEDTADRKIYTDVLVGDVWLCSGQSNMEWPLAATIDGDREIKAAENESIRVFTVPKNSVREPQTTLKGEPGQGEPANARWLKLSPEAASTFSAVGYHFGTTIHEATGRPVGLIDSSWGGTPSEAWTREATLETLETAGPLLERWEKYDAAAKAGKAAEGNWNGKYGPTHPHHPGNLNNGMIAPLVPFALKGAIWYQGESNAGRAEQYDEIFPAMIEDWRDQFGQDLPFFWVQLANYMESKEDPNVGSEWAELREAQDNTLDELKDVGQAVIIDIGEANDIHPRNKEDVGERLALAALETVYGMDAPGRLSPRFKEAQLNGKTATIAFDVDDDALQIRRDEYEAGANEALGFAVAGPDKTFHWAKAELTGPDTVKVTAPEGVSEIVAVRYAWADNPKVTLFNTRGLPAAPFRTDDWPRVTAGRY
ncbi:sialate O-acetylesterase [Alienimonas sp. DA493]|uniref:sialate O-acetylesterase n=1 Tax=Alienimonas sp. DA493 TaxID=3373605 RepID=UPI003755350C